MKSIVFAVALVSGATFAYADTKGADMKHVHGSEPRMATVDRTRTTHQAMAFVKKVDTTSGKVTLAHEPIKTLNWPAMTMPFVVKDKTLLGRLSEGQKVQVELQQQGKDYVIISAK